jgi:hypothetical protein
MAAQLNDIEARILGSLIEKSLTTPDQYPLSYNSLVLACNQKTSREPVMDLNEESVGAGLHTLSQADLVERVHEPGSRVPKFRHCAQNLLQSSEPKTVGLICVLLLRGPQTPGELKARMERLCTFESTSEVESLLEALGGQADPFVAKLPRQPGKKEARYRHLFSGGPAPAAAAPEPAAPDRLAELEQRVAALEARLQALGK